MNRKLSRIAVSTFSVLAVLATTPSTSAKERDAERGKQLYESRCIACHSMDANRTGPAHRGVFGRRAGQVKGYDYSAALKKSTIVWNDISLDRWLANPEKLVRGQKMGFSVPDATDRADLIEYLKSESRK
jgi:cytochrome c